MPGMIHLEDVHAPVADLLAEQLDEVALIFERQLASDLPAVAELCRHVERYRGKMLRPTLVLLSGLAAAGESEQPDTLNDAHRTLAAVVEMIHMATLVHDDVLDDAEVRRSGATVNHLRGNETAVMLGDYLISNAFALCSSLGDPAINLALGQVTNTLCEGELIQLHHRDDLDLEEQTYFEILRRKTATLVGECCRLGARLSGASEDVSQAMHRFGESLGIAFQIQDDVLDLAGDQQVVGKSLGRDLDKGKMTLPVILYLAEASGPKQAALRELIKNHRTEQVSRQLFNNGACTEARSKAAEFVSDARLELAHLPHTPVRDLLHSLAEAVLAREY